MQNAYERTAVDTTARLHSDAALKEIRRDECVATSVVYGILIYSGLIVLAVGIEAIRYSL